MFGATAAAMLALRTYGNDPHAMLCAAVDAWHAAYPLPDEVGYVSDEADDYILNKYMSHIENWGLDC